VYRTLPNFRGDSKIATWIYAIAVRIALRHKGRRTRTPKPLDFDPVAPRSENPAVARERSERLANALLRLSVEHRAVISLFAVEGLSHKEVAKVLGVPEGTVWSRLHLARKKLASELGDVMS